MLYSGPKGNFVKFSAPSIKRILFLLKPDFNITKSIASLIKPTGIFFVLFFSLFLSSLWKYEVSVSLFIQNKSGCELFLIRFGYFSHLTSH